MIKNKSIRLKTAKGRKISSSNWLHRQLNDPYVQQANTEGYRSRAAYKLLEIDAKYSILNNQDTIIDLGSSPGSWSQVASKRCRRVIAIDLIAMPPIEKVEFIQSNFLDSHSQIKNLVGDANVILSDMAPASCGHTSTDHIRIISLAHEVLKFAINILKLEGSVVTKIFHGHGSTELFNEFKKHFKKVKYYKPNATRQESSEIYLVATTFLG